VEFSAESGEAAGRMDLLTVIGHEIGNVLGLQDQAPDYTGLMSATLDPDTRLEFQPGSVEPGEAVADGQLLSAQFTLAWMSFVAQNPALASILPQFTPLHGFTPVGQALFETRSLAPPGALR
jgi:hypothetical protein